VRGLSHFPHLLFNLWQPADVQQQPNLQKPLLHLLRSHPPLNQLLLKYTQPVEIKKVTEETPVKSAPKQPNLSMKDYMDDFKVRWEIHQFETQELWSDMKKGYAFAQPFVVKSIDYIKNSYDRAFNQEKTKQTT